MMYQNNKCPHCNKKFAEGDDIAVCPECGTPHHRACYFERGECVNIALHAEDFVWEDKTKPVEAPPMPYGPQSGVTVTYPQGEPNPYTVNQQSHDQEYGAPPHTTDYGYSINSKEFDGISVADWIKYIGRNAGYYLSFFQLQDDTGRKTSFTFTAMLFPPIYFLYRKLWFVAILAFIANTVLGLPSTMLLLAESGIVPNVNLAFWSMIGTYARFLNMSVNVAWGLFAVKLYRAASARKIKAIKTRSATEQEYKSRLERISGPSMLAIVLPLVLVTVVYGILTYL
jgi:hypothetical protein